MKLIITLLLISNLALAKEIYFNQFEVLEGFDSKFLISHDSSHLNTSVLDCQSFFQKFDFYDANDQLYRENFITISECEYLFENINQCLDDTGQKCINTDDIFNDSCQCN